MLPMRRFAMLTVLLAGGCDPGGPNGKRGELFFSTSLEPVAAGLALDVLIPRHMSLGGVGKLNFDRKEVFDFDFTSTVLELTTSGGLVALEQELLEDGWRVRVLCDAAPGATGELDVSVVTESGEQRYGDAFDLTCHRADTLGVLPLAFTRVVLGARITVSAQLRALDGERPAITLHGLGVAVAETTAPLLEMITPSPASVDEALELRSLRPGRDPELVAGAVRTALPLEIVSDDTWTLEVEIGPRAGQDGVYDWRGVARHSDGAEVAGLHDCDVDIRTASATHFTGSPTCIGALTLSETTGEICLKIPGDRMVCRPFSF